MKIQICNILFEKIFDYFFLEQIKYFSKVFTQRYFLILFTQSANKSFIKKEVYQ